MILGYALIFIASFFLGSFGIGFKYNKPLAWENFWSIHALVGMILFPVIWASIVVPHLWTVISQSPPEALIKCMGFGFLWGIGGMLFGMSIKYVGASMTYGVVMGVCGVLGSIIPLFQIPNVSDKEGFSLILLGNAVLLVGVALIAWAGIMREKRQQQAGVLVEGVKTGKDFWKGMLIVLSSGILSSFINIGFANAGGIVDNAISHGTLPRNASLASWVVVLSGAFIFNLIYVVVEMFRNRTWHLYKAANSSNAYKWAILSAILFFGYAGIYGQGTVLLGKIGAIVGWPILLALSLIFSNLWAVKTGEWKGYNKLLYAVFAGVMVLIGASAILAYANGLIM
jgi:L-rhamnose-H+ transport protein